MKKLLVLLFLGVSLFSAKLLANDVKEEMESTLNLRLPYVTVVASKENYVVFFTNVTKKYVDCYVLVEGTGVYPVMLSMEPRQVSEPIAINGHETKFKYACKFIRRT